jgi:hypothetical protein
MLCSRFDGLLAADVAANPFEGKKGNGGLRYFIDKPAWPADRQRPLKNLGYGRDLFTPLLARNAVVGLVPGEWAVAAFSRTDESVLWQVPLPAPPVLGGLAMTRAGNVLAPLLDGRLVCIGDEREGVSLRAASAASADTAPGWLVRYCDVESGAALKSEPVAAFPIVAAKLDKPCAVRVEGMLKVTEPGKYVFSVQSHDTDSTIFLNGREEMRANRYGVHLTGDIWLAAGNHAITITCLGSGTGSEKLTMRWQRPGKNKPEDIDATCLLHVNGP